LPRTLIGGLARYSSPCVDPHGAALGTTTTNISIT